MSHLTRPTRQRSGCWGSALPRFPQAMGFTADVALALTVLTVGSSAAEPVRAAPPRLALAPALAPASAASAPHQQASTVWLCRPGLRDNPCEANLTTTVVRSTGATNVQRAAPAKNPPIDCFYVYP